MYLPENHFFHREIVCGFDFRNLIAAEVHHLDETVFEVEPFIVCHENPDICRKPGKTVFFETAGFHIVVITVDMFRTVSGKCDFHQIKII